MYIYWEEISRGHMRRILDNERLDFYCDVDEYGYDCLNLRIGEEVYCVCNSEEWTQGRPKLDCYYVGIYFTEVVKAVFEIIAKGELEVIDLAKIQEQMMESFWKEWKEKGYVED